MGLKSSTVRLATAVAICGVANVGEAAPERVRTAFTQSATLTATPTPGITTGTSNLPPASFNPSHFGVLTTDTLPMENGKRVVGRVNGKPLAWDDFTLQVRLMGARLYERYPNEDDGIRKVLVTPVMEALFLQEMYFQFAAANALTVQDAEKTRRRAEFLKSPDPAELKVFASLSAEQTDRLITAALVREKVIKFIGDRATSMPPTLSEIKTFSESGLATTSPLTITRASHIVVRATPDMSQFNINDAEARAREALEKVQGGMDFAEAARHYSQDRFTASLGGNLGYYKAGSMYPEFEKAADKLEPGEVSNVVRTAVGFHIIKVTERHSDDTLYLVEKWKRQAALELWKMDFQKSGKLENYLEQ